MRSHMLYQVDLHFVRFVTTVNIALKSPFWVSIDLVIDEILRLPKLHLTVLSLAAVDFFNLLLRLLILFS